MSWQEEAGLRGYAIDYDYEDYDDEVCPRVEIIQDGILRSHLRWTQGGYIMLLNFSAWEGLHAVFVYENPHDESAIHGIGSNWMLV